MKKIPNNFEPVCFMAIFVKLLAFVCSLFCRDVCFFVTSSTVTCNNVIYGYYRWNCTFSLFKKRVNQMKSCILWCNKIHSQHH